MNTTTVNDFLKYISTGQKIAAIKSLRMMTGLGLKEAKDFVEYVHPYVRPEAPKPKADPMAGRVLIVDVKNTDRVLGSIPRPTGNSPKCDGGDSYVVAVMGPISVSAFDPYASIMDTSVSHVRFGFRAVNWNVVLTTGAPLDHLAQIRDFRFPGESEEQAHCRQMYAR